MTAEEFEERQHRAIAAKASCFAQDRADVQHAVEWTSRKPEPEDWEKAKRLGGI